MSTYFPSLTLWLNLCAASPEPEQEPLLLERPRTGKYVVWDRRLWVYIDVKVERRFGAVEAVGEPIVLETAAGVKVTEAAYSIVR